MEGVRAYEGCIEVKVVVPPWMGGGQSTIIPLLPPHGSTGAVSLALARAPHNSGGNVSGTYMIALFDGDAYFSTSSSEERVRDRRQVP